MIDAQDTFSPEGSLKTVSADLLRLMWSLRQTANRAFGPLGMSTLQAMTLTYIAQGHTSPKGLAKVIDVHATAVSALLADFEMKGFVERLREAQDKRRVEVILTDLGKEAAESMERAWRDTLPFEGLNPGELQELNKLCLVILGEGAS